MTPQPPTDRPAALAALIEQHRDTPFAWGAHDCCMWPAKAVRAQTGKDLAKGIRGKYRSAIGARRILKENFGGRIERIPATYGLKMVPLLMARRGDLVSKKFEGEGIALGVCVGDKAAFAGPDGLVFHLVSGCRKAWRVV